MMQRVYHMMQGGFVMEVLSPRCLSLTTATTAKAVTTATSVTTVTTPKAMTTVTRFKPRRCFCLLVRMWLLESVAVGFTLNSFLTQ